MSLPAYYRQRIRKGPHWQWENKVQSTKRKRKKKWSRVWLNLCPFHGQNHVAPHLACI